jgi:3-methyl-2-oxobutanoate hydroxymethyltransferase
MVTKSSRPTVAERIAAYREFISDVQTGAYPEPQHVVPVADEELSAFKASLGL